MSTRENYARFIASKAVQYRARGLDVVPPLHPVLFDYQQSVTAFALEKGCSAMFLDTGLGKTLCQLEWARHVPGDVLILAPLAVGAQTCREAAKIGMEATQSRDGTKAGKITVANYERIHLFDVDQFVGVVLDESSILKGLSGKTTQALIAAFAHHPFRLACTATPAPNDYDELGNHAEFLGVMARTEMLQRWFIHDSANTADWRLKSHAQKDFWEWVGSWAACASMPSDAGGDDSKHILPTLTTAPHFVMTDIVTGKADDELFRSAELSATSMHKDKRATMADRVACVLELCADDDFHLVWCESNAESDALAKAFGPRCVEVSGADSLDSKEAKLMRFINGEVKILVSKASICGFGLNFQFCNHVVFASISYSYESFYQAIRRSWRFGQTRPVQVDCVMADTENSIWQTIQRKINSHSDMKSEMRHASLSAGKARKVKEPYMPNHQTILPSWLTCSHE
jgi:superfamily II DNA or RNA helicase